MNAKCVCGCVKFFDGPYREEQWLVVCVKCLTLYQINPLTAELKIMIEQLTEKEHVEYGVKAQSGKQGTTYQPEFKSKQKKT